jgi:selenocysteine lyase/cysteine desulfurase
MEWVEGRDGGRAGWIAATQAATAHAHERLAEAQRVRVVDPGGPGSGLIALDVDGRDSVEAAGFLSQRGVLVRFIPGTAYVRISVGAWVDDDDLDRLLAGLAELPE